MTTRNPPTPTAVGRKTRKKASQEELAARRARRAQVPTQSALLTKAQLETYVGLKYPVIWGMMREEAFPRSIKLSEGRVAWLRDEVDPWIKSRPRQTLKAPDPKQSPSAQPCVHGRRRWDARRDGPVQR
jgi:predicted DNA-binding transcriptional regulator AlpA